MAMELEREDFATTGDNAGKTNAFIKELTDAYYAHDPDEDPTDQVTVKFELASGL